MIKSNSGSVLYAGGIISLLLYIFLSYFIQRHQSLVLVGGYTALFALFLIMWRHAETSNQIRWLVLIGILFRLSLLGSFPNLSDDIYRFVWDGRLVNSGFHPFSHLPSYYMTPGSPEVPGITSRLYYLLNSPNYFTIYPPVAQLFFSVATAIFPNGIHASAIVIRSFIIVAEFGSLWFMSRMLFYYKLPAKNVLLYALNPLIILELTGNLHFEAFMIFFLVAGIHFFITNKKVTSSLALAFAIASKLLPLIFLPLFIRRLRMKWLLLFYLLVTVFTLILFLPLLHPDLLKGMGSSLQLYFQRFEFNASIYYLLREVGFYIKGYNTIAVLGKYLAGASFIVILAYALLHNAKKIKIPEAMLWVLMFYFMLTTTLHPWYIATVLALSVFTGFRFPVLWSFMIFLTYIGYSETGFSEILWLTIIEYVAVFCFMLYEIFKCYFRSDTSSVSKGIRVYE